MARFENENKQDEITSGLQSEIDQLKKGLKRKQSRKILGCGSCALLLALMVIVVAIISAFILVKAGIIKIPYASELLYTEPKPTYIVSAESFQPGTDLFSMLKKNILDSVTRIGSALNSSADLRLSDSQLTDLIQGQVKNNDNLNKRIDYLQIAVMPKNLELFIKLKEPKEIFLIFEIVPTVNDNQIDLKVASFKIGNLTLPNFIGKVIIAPISEKVLNVALKPFLGFGKIQAIGLDYGRVNINILITSLEGML